MRLVDLLKNAPSGGHVLDYGCFGWKLVDLAKRDDLNHHGCDIMKPSKKPETATFHLVNPETQIIDVPDDCFDLVIASHVIEHVRDPVRLFSELARVCKPDGIIYIEAPSERSIAQKSDSNVRSHSFYSFWDDPTHIRPWTPAAFYRLAICHGYLPVEARYITSWKAKIIFPLKWLFYSLIGDRHKLTEALWEAKGWSCYAIIQKPVEMSGAPRFKYLSLKDTPQGLEAALKLYHQL